jgi:hypothetical protein
MIRVKYGLVHGTATQYAHPMKCRRCGKLLKETKQRSPLECCNKCKKKGIK